MGFALIPNLARIPSGRVLADDTPTADEEEITVTTTHDIYLYIDPDSVAHMQIGFEISGSRAKDVNQFSLLVTDKPYTESNAKTLYYGVLDITPDQIQSGSTIYDNLPAGIYGLWDYDFITYIVAEVVTNDSGVVLKSTPTRVKPSSGYGTVALQVERVYDLRYGDYTGKRYQMDAIYEIWNDYVDRQFNDELDVVDLDLDRDGTLDVRWGGEWSFIYSVAGLDTSQYNGYIKRLDSCSVFGTIAFNEPECDLGGYNSVIFKLPECKPVINKVQPSDNGVLIRWNKVSGYSRFNVYRSTSSEGTYSYIGSVTDGSTKYVDTTAQSGTLYFYKVRPYTKCTDSEGRTRTIYATYSDPYPVHILGDTKLTAEPKSGVTMRLSWTAVSGAEYYEIYRATSENGTYSYVKSTTGTSTSDTGLKAGTRYYYMIRAVQNEDGTKNYSKYAGAVAVALATPTMESATFKSGKGVTLSWTKASGADRYNVYRYNTSTGKYDYVASVLGGTLTYTDASGRKGDYYKVRAYKRVDGVVYYGGWSNAKAGK